MTETEKAVVTDAVLMKLIYFKEKEQIKQEAAHISLQLLQMS